MKTIGFILSAILIISTTALLGGCQNAVKSGWGTLQTALPCNQKLVNVAWKGEAADLWLLTRPFRVEDLPETYRFKAKSTFGILEGEVIITEAKCA